MGSAGFEPAVTSVLVSDNPEARMLTKLHHDPDSKNCGANECVFLIA